MHAEGSKKKQTSRKDRKNGDLLNGNTLSATTKRFVVVFFTAFHLKLCKISIRNSKFEIQNKSVSEADEIVVSCEIHARREIIIFDSLLTLLFLV